MATLYFRAESNGVKFEELSIDLPGMELTPEAWEIMKQTLPVAFASMMTPTEEKKAEMEAKATISADLEVTKSSYPQEEAKAE